MMVDSRQKGARAETVLRDLLRIRTKLNWERIPLSGALDKKHGLKGDLYVPGVNIRYCVEVKHYKEDQIGSNILLTKNPMLFSWWEQTCREANEINKEPLLVYKYDRSKWYAVQEDISTLDINCLHIYRADIDIQLSITDLEAWLKINGDNIVT